MARAEPATPGAEATPQSLRKLYMRGLSLHLTNPKAILTWLSIVSIGLPRAASTRPSGAGSKARWRWFSAWPESGC